MNADGSARDELAERYLLEEGSVLLTGVQALAQSETRKPVKNFASEKEPLPPAGEMLRLLSGFITTQAIHGAARLGVADLLADGPKRVEELATTTAAHAPSLRRLLHYLASIGVVYEDADGRFSLTLLGDTLRTDSPFSVRDAAMLFGAPLFWSAMGDLFHGVMTGEDAFTHVHGASFFDYLADRRGEAAAFNAWMTRSSELQAAAVLSAYDFSGFSTLVDIGGGHGALLAGILSAYPFLHGILFDLADVVDGARKVEAISDRCQRVGGSFFESVPAGGDAYILQHVLHDWSDERAVDILKNCREAIAESGKLLVIEMLVPPDGEPDPSPYLDLLMMTLGGGRERSEVQFAELFDRAGFRLDRVIPMLSPFSILEGSPRGKGARG